MLATPGVAVGIDTVAKAAYLTLGDTWVSFDLPQTLHMKIQAARDWNLGGLMVSAARAARAAPRHAAQGVHPYAQGKSWAQPTTIPHMPTRLRSHTRSRPLARPPTRCSFLPPGVVC